MSWSCFGPRSCMAYGGMMAWLLPLFYLVKVYITMAYNRLSYVGGHYKNRRYFDARYIFT